MKDTFYNAAKIALVGGFIALAIFTLLFIFRATELKFSAPLKTEVFDHYGSLIGGFVGALFSLASILLLIHTIQEQNYDQTRQKVESRFYELLKIHRENCNEIQLEGITGKYAIQQMIREVRLCVELALELNEKLENRYSEERILNFAYLAFYFGVTAYERSKTLKTFMLSVEDYDPNFVKDFINLFTVNRKRYKEEHNFSYNVFGGHQIRLNQYFKHLFLTVTYINNQPSKDLSYKEKYEYIEMLIAQLSPHEQVLLFYNSMSILGEEWERKYADNPNKQLITKYNLIKDIFSFVLRYSKYYPCVKFETRPEPECRKALLKIYR